MCVSHFNRFFPATAEPISTKVGAWLNTPCRGINLKNQEGWSLVSFYTYKKKLSIFLSLSVSLFSETAKPIWTKPGRTVGAVSAFMNPGNQDDRAQDPDIIS